MASRDLEALRSVVKMVLPVVVFHHVGEDRWVPAGVLASEDDEVVEFTADQADAVARALAWGS